ncbi:MAG: peptidylprolyl isomerase [Bacteroidota bacterium]
MAVIQTIRNKYGKIAGGVIAVALVGFIVSDASSGSFGEFFSNRQSHVMKINGRKVDQKEYQMRLKEYETLYAMFNNSKNLDDATRAQLSEQVVQQMVYEAAVEEQCDKLGIITSDAEKKELIYGMNADPLVRQFQIDGQQIFINRETNQFDPQIITYMEKQFVEAPQKIDPSGKLREQWEMVKSYVMRSSRVNKYNAMFGGAIYVPSFLTKRSMQDQNSTASIKYVKVPYTAIADNDVKVTDDELNDYIKKHESLFRNDQPTRSIEYVSFDINASSADTARAVDALNEMKADFATTKDVKTFVNSKTEDANSYTEAYLNKRTFTSRNADTLMSLPVGEIYGPYYENGSYRLTKITDKRVLPDSSKVRHILVRTKAQGNEVRTDTAAKQKMDSAMALLKAGAKFDSVVRIFSEDDGSKDKGGEYTFTLTQRPTISKEFGDFAFEGKTGESKLVKVSNDAYAGYHYIEVIEQHGTAPAVQIATIAKNLIPSDSTVNAIYGKANEFAGKNTTPEAFDATVKKENLQKRMGDGVKVTNFTIQGLGSSREVIRWMFDHKVGEVSPVFQLGDERYVVAKLTAIEEKGIAKVNAANRQLLEQRVREEKKAELIAKKYGSSASLEALAQSTGQTVQQSDSVTLAAAYIPNLGYEPKVVGYTFNQSFQPNTVSPGLKGQGGVYFITVLNRTVNPLPPDNAMEGIIRMQRQQQEMQMKNTVSQVLQQTVAKKADVEYVPANF